MRGKGSSRYFPIDSEQTIHPPTPASGGDSKELASLAGRRYTVSPAGGGLRGWRKQITLP